MITLLLKLLDSLVKLAERRELLTEKEFCRIVEPTLRDTELIYRDFVRIFTQLEKRVNRTKRSQTLIRFLEEERLNLLPVRMRLRALLKTGFQDRGKFSKFEVGVWGVVSGGISPYMDTHLYPGHSRNPHALLGIVWALHDRALEDSKPTFVRYVRDQIEALHYSWQTVSEGFAELQLQTVNRARAVATRPKYEYRRIGD